MNNSVNKVGRIAVDKVDKKRNCPWKIMFRVNGQEVCIELPYDRSFIGEEKARDIISEQGYCIDDGYRPYVCKNYSPDTVYISDHGMERLRKRLGLKTKAARRMALKAYNEGMEVEDTYGSIRHRLEYKEQQMIAHGKNAEYRIYGQNVFIFSDNVLVTVVNSIDKEKIDNHDKRAKERYNRARERRNTFLEYAC